MVRLRSARFSSEVVMNRSRNAYARRGLAAVTGLAAMFLTPGVGGAQAPEAGVYTAAQAASGRAVYERECAVCHQANLQGSFEAPQLAGDSFLRFWADLSPGDLFVRVSGSMPPGEEGSLTDEEYVDVVAYLLEANGAPAGGAVLTATADVAIGTLAGGGSPAAPATAGGAAASAASAAAAGGAPSASPTAAAGASPAPESGGVTLSGTVADYRPVTGEMLRDPDDGDWLMIRRNYEAWSYSPLADVDRSNVGGLELAWVWAMNEGGWNAPSPIVHDGVMFLAGIGPVVQASTPPPATSCGSTRWRWRRPATRA